MQSPSPTCLESRSAPRRTGVGGGQPRGRGTMPAPIRGPGARTGGGGEGGERCTCAHGVRPSPRVDTRAPGARPAVGPVNGRRRPRGTPAPSASRSARDPLPSPRLTVAERAGVVTPRGPRLLRYPPNAVSNTQHSPPSLTYFPPGLPPNVAPLTYFPANGCSPPPEPERASRPMRKPLAPAPRPIAAGPRRSPAGQSGPPFAERQPIINGSWG